MKLREYEKAERCFATADALLNACGGAEDELLCEIKLGVGDMLLAQSRLEEAGLIGKILLKRNVAARAPSAATLNFLAHLSWRREELEKTAGYLLQALRAISLDTNPDVQLWAQIVQRLAHALQFVSSPAVREAVAYHVAALPWTDELADSHSEVYRLLGTRAVLDGAITEAFGLYKRAATTPAASLSIRVAAILERAELALWLGEPFSFEDHLLEATALAQLIDWRGALPNTREILLLLAQKHARRDGALALSFAAQFEAIGGFGVVGAGPGPAAAQQNYCLGLLYAETGERDRGVAMLEAAYAEFVRLRYDWPAGQTAILLAEIMSSTAWRARARELLERYPRSYLNRRLALLDSLGGATTRNAVHPGVEDPKVALLTPAQRAVYRRLLENVSVKEIASDLHRSDHTVRNHIQAIFRKLEVTSRADLIYARPEKPQLRPNARS